MEITQDNMAAYWMPFTANRQFKQSPRILHKAFGKYYESIDGSQILDGTSGLWCCNAGHGREEIANAVASQVKKMDYAPAFQIGHPEQFELANRLIKHTPCGLNKVFFTNSGSESVETALKIAIQYHRLKGNGNKKMLVGRVKGYHGVSFAGVSVGGIVNNRAAYQSHFNPVAHLPCTHHLPENEFSKGLPLDHGLKYAKALEDIVQLHGADNIAALIIEPVAGSGGVLVPPVGYLQKLREITNAHDILLIFDEVITGFGRVGEAFAAKRWNVLPDMICSAKGLTNGTVPMGAVFIQDEITDLFLKKATNDIEFFHGYTYSGHPVATKAAMAALDIYERDSLFQAALNLEQEFEQALHGLRDLPNVIDIRNVGLMGAIEFKPKAEKPGSLGYEIFTECFNNGLLVRCTADTIALSPPLIINQDDIRAIVSILSAAIETVAAKENKQPRTREVI